MKCSNYSLVLNKGAFILKDVTAMQVERRYVSRCNMRKCDMEDKNCQ